MIRLLMFGAVLALVTFWLHRRLVRAPGLGRPWSIIVDAVLVSLWALVIIGIGSGEVFDPGWARIPGFVGMVWLAAVFYLILGLLVVAVVSLLARLLRSVRRRGPAPAAGPAVEPAGTSRRRVLQVATAVVAVGAIATAGYGVVEAARPRIVRVRVPLRRLPPEFVGLRVALVSDLHVGPTRGREFTARVVDLVNEQRPDLIVIAGDLIDGTVAKVAADLEPLAELVAPLGVFGVSGNHEFYADDGGRWLDVWDRLGVRTLRNERVSVNRDGASIDLVGIHDYSSPKPYEPDLDAALAGRDPSTFALLIAHEPRQALEASDLGVDLQLSGHTHGGQMWPIRYLVPVQQPSVQGLDRIGNTTLYTTRGAGAWGPPVRVGAPPEVTILTLDRPD
ncbi:MAG: metallophosphoesterase [Gordonia sp.]|uniref:Metallophosphoesterase n=1 Tax=Gordonia rubripertincta TaxID=36822 RepID=A0ABT4MVH0_GORRU|nr:metallophosphoesterase [Gordonia rubripertincta]MBA4020974.1 metallophosphoesterase [Gordonia sp. (in: high G+C Gram-positive bacteria)]MCZ4550809.1 metallophosphoesterase [Gordonia rubripertincta]